MFRRDSFITHRAFCDALAEETARFTAASSQMTGHASNINYQFIGSSSLGQHFPPSFKLNHTNDKNNIISPLIPTGRGQPLWTMAREGPGHVEDSIPENLQETPFTFGALTNFPHDPVLVNNPSSISPPSTYHLMNWDLGNGNLSNAKEVSVPCLFSTQTQSHQPSNAAISATALLQSAANIGATQTGPNPFLESFGLKDNGNKLNGFYGTSSGTSGVGSDVEHSVNDISALNQLEMYLSKRRRLSNEEVATGGETRDFLGVGLESICHPSSINGWI